MSKTGQGVIVSCRRRPKAQKPKEYILRFPGIESVGEAARLLGRKVAWPIRKHEARGKIVALHGKNGLVRTRFKKGVPGPSTWKSSGNDRLNQSTLSSISVTLTF